MCAQSQAASEWSKSAGWSATRNRARAGLKPRRYRYKAPLRGLRSGGGVGFVGQRPPRSHPRVLGGRVLLVPVFPKTSEVWRARLCRVLHSLDTT